MDNFSIVQWFVTTFIGTSTAQKNEIDQWQYVYINSISMILKFKYPEEIQNSRSYILKNA